jgi:hypothetical protein
MLVFGWRARAAEAAKGTEYLSPRAGHTVLRMSPLLCLKLLAVYIWCEPALMSSASTSALCAQPPPKHIRLTPPPKSPTQLQSEPEPRPRRRPTLKWSNSSCLPSGVKQ